MDTFRRVTEQMLDFLLNFEENKDERAENTTFKLTSFGSEFGKNESENTKINAWMKTKFESFIREKFYQGILEIQETKDLTNEEKHKVEVNAKLWELLREEKKSSTDSQVNTEVNVSLKNIQVKDIHSTFRKAYFDKNEAILASEESSKAKKSSILKFYDHVIQKNPKTSHETISTTYISDFSSFQISRITVVNPQISVLSKAIQLHINQKKVTDNLSILEEQSIFFTKPETIILTSSSLLTLLSTISLTHLLFYWNFSQESYQAKINSNLEKEAFFRAGTKEIIPIVTTREIYDQYLELFTFIQIISSFVRDHENLIGSYSESEGEKSELNYKYEEFLKIHEEGTRNKSHYIFSRYHFKITNPEQRITLKKLEICLRNFNLYPFYTYDLEVYDSLNGKYLALIEENSLKSVKNIYYTQKKGYLTEELYQYVVKRLEEKETFLKQNENNFERYFPSENKSFQEEKSLNSMSFKYLNLELRNEKTKKCIKKTSLLVNPIKNAPDNSKIFNEPHSIDIETVNKLFVQIRKIECFSLLSDTDIFQIIKAGIVLELRRDQTVYRANTRFEHLFIVIDGVCKVEEKDQSKKEFFIEENNVFGWSYFLKNALRDHEEASQKEMKEYANEEEMTLSVYSNEALMLRVEINILQYLVFDKLNLLRQIHFSKINEKTLKNHSKANKIHQVIAETLTPTSESTSVINQSNELAKILISPQMIERFKVFRKLCSGPNTHQIDFLDELSENPLKTLFLNYPNILLIF